MTDKSLMPFGKHQGKPMIEVPASYLLWLHDNAKDLRDPLKSYIKENIDVLRAEVKRQTKRD